MYIYIYILNRQKSDILLRFLFIVQLYIVVEYLVESEKKQEKKSINKI